MGKLCCTPVGKVGRSPALLRLAGAQGWLRVAGAAFWGAEAHRHLYTATVRSVEGVWRPGAGRAGWLGQHPGSAHLLGLRRSKVGLHTGAVAWAAVILAVLGRGRDSGGPLSDGRLGGLGRWSGSSCVGVGDTHECFH